MFLNKVFRKESIKEEEEPSVSNVCIVQLVYDFEERLLGTCASSVPILSFQISIFGLGQDLRLELVQTFPWAKVRKGYVDILGDSVPKNDDEAELLRRTSIQSQTPDSPNSKESSQESTNNNDGEYSNYYLQKQKRFNSTRNERVSDLATVMKLVTSILSFVRTKEFSVISSTVDSSSFSGYVNKTYSWTLQK